ncbi:hypothetical protein H5410_015919 [Solanum commersonii]|uniref:DUF4283 domain-containing protein n=1 Tax=Solanum commersonii TaxID=4109 RepID=A0A9J5ZW01_SOLCO|nr:hypothetical protein H5410_015919 [Solanum commersonii]
MGLSIWLRSGQNFHCVGVEDERQEKPQILYHYDGYYVFRFDSVADRNEVMRDGPYTYHNKPFVLQNWEASFMFDTKCITTIPLWVNFPRLPVGYLSAEALSKFGRATKDCWAKPHDPPVEEFNEAPKRKIRATSISVLLTIVYARNEQSQREVLWQKFQARIAKMRSFQEMTSSSDTTPTMVTQIEGLCSKCFPITFGSYLFSLFSSIPEEMEETVEVPQASIFDALSLISYARILVEVDVSLPLIEYVERASPDGTYTQRIDYEWRPKKFHHYLKFKHIEDQCRAKQEQPEDEFHQAPRRRQNRGRRGQQKNNKQLWTIRPVGDPKPPVPTNPEDSSQMMQMNIQEEGQTSHKLDR